MSPPFDGQSARLAMPAGYGAFLARFGRLTPIQAEAMPVLLDGRNVVVVAPSASGKTEAALTPLCERLSRDPPVRGARLVYVVPTKALSNDIELRASGPASVLGLKLVVRTGDRPAALKDGSVDILVTTPESLDSMLCRIPGVLATVRALVVDEAHVLDGTSRGDQMRVLVRRLTRLVFPASAQLVAMSATVADPAGLGRRLLGPGTTVVRAGAPRALDLRYEPDLATAVAGLRTDGVTKAVIFCNSRRRVETAAADLRRKSPWPPERVMVHHASLSKREREDVEAAFRRWQAGLLVCTTTIELGVDVGDIDAVVLAGAPPTVESFLQRVGRGCRRKAGIVAVCVPEDDADRRAFEAIEAEVASAGRGGWSGKSEQEKGGTDTGFPGKPVSVPPFSTASDDDVTDLGVAVQQVFSILYGARGGMSRRDLHGLLSPLAEAAELDEILAHLVETGWITTGGGGRFAATTALIDLGEKGRVHSNISDSRTIDVVDQASGRVLGRVSAADRDGSLSLGGKAWRVVGGDRGSIQVEAGNAFDTGQARFGTRGGESAFRRYLPASLR